MIALHGFIPVSMRYQVLGLCGIQQDGVNAATPEELPHL